MNESSLLQDPPPPTTGRMVQPVGWTLATGPDWIAASPSPDLIAGRAESSAEEMLRQNSVFPPRLKWLSGASLRMDVIAGEEEPSPYLYAAVTALAGSSEAGLWSREIQIDPPPLAEWVSEAGWESRVVTGDSEVHQIPLDLPGASPARLETDERHAGVELRFDYPPTISTTDGTTDDPITFEARSHLLLCLAREFRLIVPALSADGTFHLRVSLPGLSDAARLRIGLSALYLALKESITEFEALADPGVAGAYLNSLAHSHGDHGGQP